MDIQLLTASVNTMLGKAIEYIAYRVKNGHEEKASKRDLLEHLKYLIKFYSDVIFNFENNYSSAATSSEGSELTSTFEKILDIKHAKNIWQYLEFDKIFMIENKTIIEHLIDIEYNRAELDNTTFAYKRTMSTDINARTWFSSNDQIEYMKLIQEAALFISQLKTQIVLINKLIEKLSVQ